LDHAKGRKRARFRGRNRKRKRLLKRPGRNKKGREGCRINTPPLKPGETLVTASLERRHAIANHKGEKKGI